ncbi:MAG: oxygenase MpaB family protein [Algoriphagus sp.]|nr:oxygenase MpaB family protein [Algoriphagus sp.]
MSKLNLYQNSYLNDLRQIQDEPADQAVRVLIENPQLIPLINSWKEIPNTLLDDFPIELKNFFGFYQESKLNIPAEILKQGQALFNQKGDLYLAMLGFYSLPYCYAFADGAQVLVRSKRILESIGERLGETGSFVLEIFRPGAFINSQEAYLVCAKVRLIHAFSRFFVEKYDKDWNPDFGKPINQEDMIGTNLAFSLIVLRGWRKLGFKISTEETTLIMQYWKWVGGLMGINTDFWPDNSKEAFELEKLVRKRHLKESEAGRKLIGALKNYYQSTIPDPILSSQTESILAFFLGKEASKALDLKSSISIQGDLLGQLFKLSGWRNSGSAKGYSGFARQMKTSQLEKFGKELRISLPEINRS